MLDNAPQAQPWLIAGVALAIAGGCLAFRVGVWLADRVRMPAPSRSAEHDRPRDLPSR